MNRLRVPASLHRPASMTFMLAVLLALIAVMVVPVQAGGLFDPGAPTATPTARARPTIFPTRQNTGGTPNPGWLGLPDDYSKLASSRTLNLLAGKLIFTGLVDASSCPDGGLLRSGAASPCGEQVAHNASILWQNQFDEAIYAAALNQGIPPYLLKNVIVQESQFWPGSHRSGSGYPEFGLGHMTTLGADTLLRWNRDFSSAFCLQVYSEEACRTSYAFMDPNQQSVLRGAVIQRVNADCSSCPGAVDLKRARESILFIAATLNANRAHAKWYVEGLTGRSFERLDPNDAWRFTLVGYNGGPGCLTSAISRSQVLHLQLSWKSISESLDPACQGVNEYVDNVRKMDLAAPEELQAALYDASPAALLVAETSGITLYSNPPPTPQATVTSVVPPADATSTSRWIETPVPPHASQTPTASSTPAPGATDPGPTPTPSLDPALTPSDTSTPDPFLTPTDTPTPDPSITDTPSATPDGLTPSETPTPLPPRATETPTGDPFATLIPPTVTTAPPPTMEATHTPSPIATLPPPTPIVTPPPPDDEGPTVEIVVKFHALVPDFIAESIIGDTGGEAEGDVTTTNINIVRVPKSRAEQIVADLQANLMVDYVEPNYPVQVFYVPNDPGYANQTYLQDMQIPLAWEVTMGEGVIVAVIDTGLDFTHLDLIANLWANPGEMGVDNNGADKSSNGMDDDADGFVDDVFGWNFIDENNDFSDLNGHGTHVAGIIAAGVDNFYGMVGVAPKARIMPLKALDAQGNGSYADVAQAIVYAVDHGAQVINLGFGGQFDSQALRDATDYAYDHNVIVVAAAGNGGSEAPYYPAANPNVIAALALDPLRNLTSFSSYGYVYGVAAPGVGIYSTVPGGGFNYMTGTSMAAAEVSGIAALLVTQDKFNTADDVRYALFGSAFDLGDPGHDMTFGYGLAQALNALAYEPAAFQTPTPLPPPGGSASPTPTDAGGGVSIQGDAANADVANYARACPVGAVFGALGGTPVPALQADEGASGAIPIGFDFWYMGTRYTDVYASSNGWLSFTDPFGNAYPNNAVTLSAGIPRPMLAPLWDDLSGVGGTASYNTTGAAPNRVFTVEWLNWRWNRTAAGAVISFRVELYERTGVVRFRYVRNALPVVGASASAGLTGTGTGAGTFAAVNPSVSFGNVCPTWSTAVDPAAAFAKPPSGEIFTFTPPIPANPTNLRITATTDTTATLTWTDNATNENGYVIFTSTDGVNFTTQAGAVAGWQSAAVPGVGSTGTTTVTGLSNVENLYWRIYAVSEGGLSAAPSSVSPPTDLTFTNAQPTSVTLNWTDSPNDAGYIVLNSTNGTDFVFVAELAADAVSYDASGLTAGTSYAWRVQAINPRAVSSAVQGSVPGILISAPADGSTFLQGDTIAFTGLASDALEGDLTANIQWSSDLDGALGSGGTLNKTGMSLGQHIVTAQVTSASGITVTATITISITDASGNIPPSLTIASPLNNSAFTQGATVTFNGTATDSADGDLSASIQWQSSINGPLGTGASISTSALSLGTHIIAARVTDSGGLTTTKTIRIYVTNPGGYVPPDLTILSPADGATFVQGTPVGLLGSALIPVNGDISGYIQWSSSLDGALASNASGFSISSLSLGTHVITANVTDANSGLTSTASVTITIVAPPVPGDSPHGGFNGSPETCAICHGSHQAQSWGPLLISTDSPYENNNFCLSCHNAGQRTYSTHSNKDTTGMLEQPFELLCVQCHDPHDNPPNLSGIGSTVRLGTIPTPFDTMPLGSTPILFTARTGPASFDDGTGASALCVSCHQDPANAGAPMTLHNGGANHRGGVNYATQDCTSCHPHSLDASAGTLDGFATTCRACHSQAQDAGTGSPRRQVVGIPNGAGGNDNDFARASHHVAGNDTVTDADCQVCHELTQHKQGQVRLFNQDAPATVYTLDYLKNAADDPADYENFCLSCHDSNGRAGNVTPFSDKKPVPSLNTSLWAFAQHNVVKPLFTASCLDCHSNGHGSNKANMLSQYSLSAPWDWQYLGAGAAPSDVMDQEEDFCFKCHTLGGAGINVKPAFTAYSNTANSIFKHDVGLAYSTHDPGEVFASSFATVNRHVECGDCHNSHAGRSGLSVAPALPPELRGASGVEPVYGGGGAPLRYNFLTEAVYEYQVCFKCHSSYAALPVYSPDGWNGSTFVPNGLYKLITFTAPQIPDSRDMAREFNPNAGSYHPVTAVGRNPNMPASFVAGSGWTSFSRMYCSNCHTNGNPASSGNGTHGSPCLHLLRDAVNDATCNQYATVRGIVRPNNGEICFTCHRSDVYNASLSTMNVTLTYFRNGATLNLHWKHVYERNLSCYTCHDSHGSEQLHLINFDTREADIEPGYDSQSAWEATLDPNGVTVNASCYVAGGGCHDTESYTP